MDMMSGFSPTENVVEVLVTRRTNILTQLFKYFPLCCNSLSCLE